MADPCVEIERIVRMDTLIDEHGKKLDGMDNKLDQLLDTVGSLRNNKGFIGGIAAAGWLAGVLMVDMIKPFIKPVLAAVIAVIK